MGISKWGICPTLLYYRFRKKEEQYVANSVSIDKFERDIKELLDAGYASLSLKEIAEAKKTGADISSKNFCVVFHGGYEDNYSVAFPVIQRHNIHVDIFVDVDDVGRKVSADEPDYLPRLDWGQISEMVNSKLINVHAFWSPNEPNVDWFSGINDRITQLKINIDGLSDNMSFYSNKIDDEAFHKTLKVTGISSYIIPFWLITLDKLSNGAIPFICVNEESIIFDVVEEFNNKCSARLIRDETLLDETVKTLWRKEEFETIELPVDKQPIMRNYLRHAFPLSVIGTYRKDKAELFVIYEYIDVVFRPWYHWFDYDNDLYNSWNMIDCCRLNKDIVISNGINVVETIINGLYAGYYCDMWIDTYYIPGKPGYGKRHLSHCLLAYGYDKEDNVIKTLTYTNNGKYEQLDVSPENIIKSCSNDYFLSLNFMKQNKETQIVYKKDELIERLEKYLCSKYTFCINSKYNEFDRNQLCNKIACEYFPTYLLETANREQRIYQVALYGFLEHKKCMGWRLRWLLNREGIDDNVINKFEEYSFQMYQLGMNLGIKYNFTKDENMLFKLTKSLDELNKRETEAIEHTIQLLTYE